MHPHYLASRSLLVLLRSLRFPLRTESLLFVLLLTVLLSFAEHSGLFAAVLWAIGVSWFLKYAFVLADHMIEGRPDPPVLAIEMVSPLEQRPLGTFALLVAAWFGTDVLTSRMGAHAVAALRLALLAILPAMIAAMCLGGRVVDGLNPKVVLGIPRRIAGPYLMLLACLTALWTLGVVLLRAAVYPIVAGLDWQALLLGYAFSGLPWRANLALFGAHVLLLYLWLATFACIAGTVYAHRAELGFDAAVSPERGAARDAAELERQRDSVWDGIYAEARAGSPENAGDTVRKLLAGTAQPLEECRWLHERAVALGHEPLANVVAQLCLSRLLDAGATGAALELLRERFRGSREFRARTGAEALRLVELARAAGDRATARRLLADFARLYPGDPLGPVAARMETESR